jgi:arsenate reductase (glutaredoxin)
MAPVTIYHNPACGTSRSTLALIRGKQIEPEIVEYMKTPLSSATLKDLIGKMNISVRSLLRTQEATYQALGLAQDKWSDDELVDIMVAHPDLINRPIVVTAEGVRLCRPPERVLEILQ